MVRFLLNALVTGFLILVISQFLKGVEVKDPVHALIVALVLSLLNTFLKPLLVLLTIPLTLFSFGLFLLFINAFIILIADRLIEGFSVNGFGWAFLFSIILSLFNSLFEKWRRRYEK